jgi:hypothetical protein
MDIPGIGMSLYVHTSYSIALIRKIYRSSIQYIGRIVISAAELLHNITT